MCSTFVNVISSQGRAPSMRSLSVGGAQKPSGFNITQSITCNFTTGPTSLVATPEAACLLVVTATMAGAFQLLLLLGLFCTVRVHASHFRGGIIMVRPLSGGGENEVRLPVSASLYACKFIQIRPLAPKFVL